MRRGLTRRIERLEEGVGLAGGMPAELAMAGSALLASRRGRVGLGPMGGEDRAIRAAPDFRAKLVATTRWWGRHHSPGAVGQVAAILERRAKGRR